MNNNNNNEDQKSTKREHLKKKKKSIIYDIEDTSPNKYKNKDFKNKKMTLEIEEKWQEWED